MKPSFLLIIFRSLETNHFLKMWLNDNSWREIIADFWKAAEKKENMRHHFEDSLNINILNLKIKPKI